jgi:hypothetical protein
VRDLTPALQRRSGEMTAISVETLGFDIGEPYDADDAIPDRRSGPSRRPLKIRFKTMTWHRSIGRDGLARALR